MAAAKSLQLCLTLCNPIDGSPPGSTVPGIVQARTLEWVPFPSPIHESEKWKWSRSVMSGSLRPHGLQPTRLLHLWDFTGNSTGVSCHCLPRSMFEPWVNDLISIYTPMDIKWTLTTKVLTTVLWIFLLYRITG